MFRRLFARWGDAALRREVARLKEDLAAAQTALKSEERRREVAEAETQAIALVVARDRERVKAELASFARQRADSEGEAHERRT